MLLNITYVFICHLLIFLGDSFLLETLSTFGLDTVTILLLYQFYYNFILLHSNNFSNNFILFLSFLPPFPFLLLVPSQSLHHLFFLTISDFLSHICRRVYKYTHTHTYKTHMYHYIHPCIHILKWLSSSSSSASLPSLCYVSSGYYSKCRPTPVLSSCLVTFTTYFLEESQKVT